MWYLAFRYAERAAVVARVMANEADEILDIELLERQWQSLLTAFHLDGLLFAKSIRTRRDCSYGLSRYRDLESWKNVFTSRSTYSTFLLCCRHRMDRIRMRQDTTVISTLTLVNPAAILGRGLGRKKTR